MTAAALEETQLSDDDIEVVFGPEAPTSPGGVLSRTMPPSASVPSASVIVARGPASGVMPLPRLYTDEETSEDRSTVARAVIHQLAHLSNVDAIPRRLLNDEEAKNLPIQPRAAFLLAQIDGVTRLEEILDTCAVREEEALVLLRHLIELGVITLQRP